MPFGPGTLGSKSVTIKSGQQLSGPIDLSDYHFVQFIVPAMVGTSLAFYVGGYGIDTDAVGGKAALAAVTPVPLFGDDGVAITAIVPSTVPGGLGISGDKMSKICGGRFVWLKSNAPETGGDVVIQYAVKR